MRVKSMDEIIKKYPKIFQVYEGNPEGVNWHGVREGWLDIVDDMCGALQDYTDHYKRHENGQVFTPGQVTCFQVKEKFGELRFYTNGTNMYQDGIIAMAEHLCSDTCTHCGSREDVKLKGGWIEPVCKDCREKNGYLTIEESKIKRETEVKQNEE